jgi:hypothetical protein
MRYSTQDRNGDTVRFRVAKDCGDNSAFKTSAELITMTSILVPNGV